MEEEDGIAYRRGSAMGNDTLALNYSQMSSADAGSVDLVGRLKTLSSGRKKLMTKYFDLDDIESGPLLSEYFAVSLAFVALGAMIREANVRMRRKDKENSDGVSPKLQRMALDSMLKSAMERLRGLAHRTQTLEDKVRDRSYMEAAFQFERLEFLKRISGLEATIAKHAEVEAGWRREKEDLIKRIAEVDAQRGYFFKKMAEAESSLADLQRLRMEDGKANAKLVEIYAGREQSWKSERIKMRHDIDLLKELSKLQPQSQIKSPHSFDAAAEALKMRNLKRRAKEMVRDKVVSERELSVLVGVDRTPKSEVDSRSPRESTVPADDRKDSEAADTQELSAALNQEMEAELAIILKRVGALKRRGSSGSKLDELLNEAKGKPRLKRLGSFDQAPKGMVIDDTFLCRPEANNVKDVEMDEGAKDIWQAIEFQEGMNVQRRNGLVGGGSLPREPSRMSVFDSTELIHEILISPEKNISQRPPDGDGSPVRTNLLDSAEFILENPLTPERNVGERGSEESAAVDHDIAPDMVVVNRPIRNEVEPLNLDEGGWEEFILENPSTPEKNIGQSTTSKGLTFVDDDRTPDSVAVNSYLSPARNKIQPLNLDEGCWEDFILEKPNSPEKHIGERASEGSATDRASESVAVNRYLASEFTVGNEIEPLSLDEGGWEEFVEEKPTTATTPESNIGQRISKESTFADHDGAPESVAVNSILTVEPNQNETLNLDEGGWVESTDYESGWEGYSITCAEQLGSPDEAPVPSPIHDPVGLVPVDDLILFEEDIKNEIVVGKDELEEAHGLASSGSQGHRVLTIDSPVGVDLFSAESGSSSEIPDASLAHDSAVGVDVLSAGSGSPSEIPDASLSHDSAAGVDLLNAESGSPGEIPDASLAHDSVGHMESLKLSEEDVKSEIIVSNPISSSPTLGTSSDHMDQLNRTDVSEGRNDEVIDNGQSSVDHRLVVQEDSNNSVQQLAPDGTSMATLNPNILN